MNEDEVRSIIDKLQLDNPLVVKKEYQQAFIERFAKLDFPYTKKNANKLLKSLGENVKNKFIDVYRQGVSEILLWFLMNSKNIEYAIEVNENPDNNSNVDVVVNDYYGCRYNFEVKSPVISEEKSEYAIRGELSHRLDGSKKDVDAFLDDIKKKMSTVSGSVGKVFSGIDYPKDTKIMSTLQSCQEKFVDPSSSNFNCLVIVTKSEDMVRFWNYISNECETGFFDERSFYQHEKFDKVNAIVVSNALSMNEKFNNNAWDMTKACNIIICNRFSKNYLLAKKQYEKLGKLLPNNTIDFLNYLSKERKTRGPDIPVSSFKIEFVYPWKF